MTVRCENVLSKEILKTGDQLTKLNDTGRLESSNNYAKVRCSTTAVVLSSLLILSYIILNHDSCHFRTSLPTTCRQSCRVQFVESIPTGLNFSGGPVHRATHEAWLDLFNSANESIHIAALYWNLNSSEYPTAEYGRRVYEQLANAGRRGINIRIAQDASKGISDNEDSRRLAEQGLAELRCVRSTSTVC
ncbi:hypothetical protein Y032_0066g3736 [Ancylostoma ceylanicum]|uniref:Uncharacterized protein n=1 Tax=Ancylostoma ceylanicum TaxID=53326 RepID=A0A016U039_9BILA|nr:hypothetical protein Y032_0066g3736 [Ancylostoma ceylanicum]